MRSSGILLPIFSLPSDEGIGNLGEKTYEFIDFLADSGQQYWHVTPINHVDNSGSPYMNLSSFAGNILFIDLKNLVSRGWLHEDDYDRYVNKTKVNNRRIDYNSLYANKIIILKKVFNDCYDQMKDNIIDEFRSRNSAWIEDYALYICVKDHVFDGKPWTFWDQPVKFRKDVTLDVYRDQLKDKINFVIFMQYLFFIQWFDIKKYANAKNIKLIGEFLLYCNINSADVWANRHFFMLDDNGYPAQMLVNNNDWIYDRYGFESKIPYDIDLLKKTDCRYITDRLNFIHKIYDNIIISNFDHYIEYKVINLSNKEIMEIEGMGCRLFEFLRRKDFIFESSTYKYDHIQNKINSKDSLFIKVMQLGFGNENNGILLSHNYNNTDIVYTSTYNTKLLKKWKKTISMEKRSYCRKYIGKLPYELFNDAFIRKAYESAADKVIAPLQDILNLGQNSAIYDFDKKDNNWSWRVSEKLLTNSVKSKLYKLTKLYCRGN